MRRRRSIASLVLLAALLTGGLAAPWVHRVEHALDYERVRSALSHDTRHVHTGEPTFTFPLAAHVYDDVACVLCHTTSLRGVLGTAAHDAPAWTPARSLAASDVRSEARSGRLLIRGPPTMA